MSSSFEKTSPPSSHLFRKIFFFWLFKHKVPGAVYLWRWFTSEEEKKEFLRLALPTVRIFEKGNELVRKYHETSPIFSYWLTSEKFSLLQGGEFAALNGLVNFSAMIENPRNQENLFHFLIVDNESFIVFFNFFTHLKSNASHWGYPCLPTALGKYKFQIAPEEQNQFTQRFLKELAHAMSQTRVFNNRFDELLKTFYQI